MTLRPLWSLLTLCLCVSFLALAPAGTALGRATSPAPALPSSTPRFLADLAALSSLRASNCSPLSQTKLSPSPCASPDRSASQGPGNGLLALYALALDTSMESDLASAYQDAMTGLQQASNAVPATTIVALVDMPGGDNTFIYRFQAGEETLIEGLPNTSGVLSDALREYDMTDGATLGGFLLWARNTYTTTGPTTFTYVGHGGPLLPETDYEAIFSPPAPLTKAGNPLPPLPVRVDANPEFTDITPSRSLLSVHQLSEALRIGTENGNAPFAVVDLLKCLSGTIEELYPLTPYATTFTTSPSYAYFAPEMLGAGVAALNAAMSPQTLATTLVATYDNVIEGYDEDDEHPRLLVAIDSALLPDIKRSWHRVAHYLLEPGTFDSERIRAAYRASAHYDTTYCSPHDWSLQAPDAVVDLSTFAAELMTQYPTHSGIQAWAGTVQKQVNAAILIRRDHTGVPWFGTDAPEWNFESHSGIGLYADLDGRVIDNERYLSWQAHFYTSTVSADNPHPYTFLTVQADEGSWAEVLERIWAATPGLATAACLPDLPAPALTGEMSVLDILIPFPGTVIAGSPTHIVSTVRTEYAVNNPTVSVTVEMPGRTTFSETLQGRYAITGTYPAYTTGRWTPTLTTGVSSEPFTITVIADPDNQIEEENEEDNRYVITDRVWSVLTNPRPILSARLEGSPQWVNSPQVNLIVEQDPVTLSAPVRALRVDILQYEMDDPEHPEVQTPTLKATLYAHPVTLTQPIPLTLPAMLKPGLTELMVWGWSAGGISGWRPEIRVIFNYIPPQADITAGDSHFFAFSNNIGESVRLDLDVAPAQDANLFVWHPYNFGSPQYRATEPGDDTLTIPIRFHGSHAVAVYGVTDATYTLSVTTLSNATLGATPRTPLRAGIFIPDRRPIFLEPVPVPPDSFPTPPPTRHWLFLPLVVR